jgi:hypothetical protein
MFMKMKFYFEKLKWIIVILFKVKADTTNGFQVFILVNFQLLFGCSRSI